MKINYDLLNKSRQANRRFSLHHAIPETIINGLIHFGLYCGISRLLQGDTNYALASGLALGGMISRALSHKYENTRSVLRSFSRRAYEDLSDLSERFEDELKIKTNAGLLLNINKVGKNKTRLIPNKGKLPKIVQTKNLLILKETDSEEIISESIIQEHVFMSKEYTLSRNTTNKALF